MRSKLNIHLDFSSLNYLFLNIKKLSNIAKIDYNIINKISLSEIKYTKIY